MMMCYDITILYWLKKLKEEEESESEEEGGEGEEEESESEEEEMVMCDLWYHNLGVTQEV